MLHDFLTALATDTVAVVVVVVVLVVVVVVAVVVVVSRCISLLHPEVAQQSSVTRGPCTLHMTRLKHAETSQPFDVIN